MLSDQNTAMNWNISLMTACKIVPQCKIKVLKHWKLYKDAYILQESFAMTDKSHPPPCRNYLQPLYLSVTLYACAQCDKASCALVTYLIANGSHHKMVPSDKSPTNLGLAIDQLKLLFELVGDRSVTVPKPISNQLHQLPEESPWGNRQVADHL